MRGAAVDFKIGTCRAGFRVSVVGCECVSCADRWPQRERTKREVAANRLNTCADKAAVDVTICCFKAGQVISDKPFTFVSFNSQEQAGCQFKPTQRAAQIRTTKHTCTADLCRIDVGGCFTGRYTAHNPQPIGTKVGLIACHQTSDAGVISQCSPIIIATA